MVKLKEAVSYSNDEIKIKRLKIKRICTISQYPSRPKFYAPENLMNVQILFFSGFVFFQLVKSILDGGVAEVLDTGVGAAGIG